MNSEKKSLRGSYTLLSLVLGTAMGILFVSFGVGLLTRMIGTEETQTTLYQVFGGLTLLYGIFRLIRVVLLYRSTKANEE